MRDSKDWILDGEPVSFDELPVCCQENLEYGRSPCCAEDRDDDEEYPDDGERDDYCGDCPEMDMYYDPFWTEGY